MKILLNFIQVVEYFQIMVLRSPILNVCNYLSKRHAIVYELAIFDMHAGFPGHDPLERYTYQLPDSGWFVGLRSTHGGGVGIRIGYKF